MSGAAEDTLIAAGELVLGLLDHAEQLQSEARRNYDPAFAGAVVFWEQRLAPLGTFVQPVVPPSAVWSRLALATGVRAAPDPAPAGRAGFWKATTALSLLVAAGVAAIAFLPQFRPIPDEGTHFAAALAPVNTPAPFLAEARPDGRIVVTRVGNAAAAPGRTFQLWEVQAGAPQPISLGVLPPGQRLVVNQPVHGPWGQTQLLVSDEPAGGSPTGLPTGSVLFGGALTQVEAPGQ